MIETGPAIAHYGVRYYNIFYFPMAMVAMVDIIFCRKGAWPNAPTKYATEYNNFLQVVFVAGLNSFE